MSRGRRFAVEQHRAKTIFTNEAPLKLSRYSLPTRLKAPAILSQPGIYRLFAVRSPDIPKLRRSIFRLVIALGQVTAAHVTAITEYIPLYRIFPQTPRTASEHPILCSPSLPRILDASKRARAIAHCRSDPSDLASSAQFSTDLISVDLTNRSQSQLTTNFSQQYFLRLTTQTRNRLPILLIASKIFLASLIQNGDKLANYFQIINYLIA